MAEYSMKLKRKMSYFWVFRRAVVWAMCQIRSPPILSSYQVPLDLKEIPQKYPKKAVFQKILFFTFFFF